MSGLNAIIPTRQHKFLKYGRQAILKIAEPNNIIISLKIHQPSWSCVKMISLTAKCVLKRVLLVIMIKIFKDFDDFEFYL